MINWNNIGPWYFIAVYGSPYFLLRKELWEGLYDEVELIDGPWCVRGTLILFCHWIMLLVNSAKPVILLCLIGVF